MKAIAVAAVFAISTAVAQAAEMKGMDMSKGDMKGMDMSKGAKSVGVHKTTGTVKKVDQKAGMVTLDHEPVKTLNWPAMTMGFKVQDKAMLDKLAEGKKVEVEFEIRGKDYVITAVK